MTLYRIRFRRTPSGPVLTFPVRAATREAAEALTRGTGGPPTPTGTRA